MAESCGSTEIPWGKEPLQAKSSLGLGPFKNRDQRPELYESGKSAGPFRMPPAADPLSVYGSTTQHIYDSLSRSRCSHTNQLPYPSFCSGACKPFTTTAPRQISTYDERREKEGSEFYIVYFRKPNRKSVESARAFRQRDLNPSRLISRKRRKPPVIRAVFTADPTNGRWETAWKDPATYQRLHYAFQEHSSIQNYSIKWSTNRHH
ncbi:hypothetical protein J6590_003785 [Homalodisca vitripennis]|nr:hypothetical protein J6590_003785 [Homalodisca vitripennis]